MGRFDSDWSRDGTTPAPAAPLPAAPATPGAAIPVAPKGLPGAAPPAAAPTARVESDAALIRHQDAPGRLRAGLDRLVGELEASGHVSAPAAHELRVVSCRIEILFADLDGRLVEAEAELRRLRGPRT